MTDYNTTEENNKDFLTRIAQIMSKLTQVSRQYGNGLKFISHDQKTDYFNLWADYWRYVIGVNVIPADTKNKKTSIKWLQYQNSLISEEQHDKWKMQGAFNDGMAIIAGKVWHNDTKKGLYLILVDLDNQKAIDEFCTRNRVIIPLSKLAKSLIVEQHKDQPHKAHIIFYATHPFIKKSSDVGALFSKLESNDIPAIEVKGAGQHGILYCTPSLHKNGHNYEIVEGGTLEPLVLDDLEEHIDNICRKHGIEYLDGNEIENQHSSLVPIHDLFKDDTKIYGGHNRHEALLRVMESLLKRNTGILDEGQIKKLSRDWNLKHCVPPLDGKQELKQWKHATKFIKEDIKRRQLQRDREYKRQQHELAELEIQEDKRGMQEARQPLSVAEAALLNYGTQCVRGMLSSLSELYKMVRAEELECTECHTVKTIVYDHPINLTTYSKDRINYGVCSWNFDTVGCKGYVKSIPVYVNAVDCELRDPESLQDLAKVRVVLFEDDTKKVILGEVVTITGTAYVQQNRLKGKAFSTFFTECIKYDNREQSELTPLDVKAILQFKARFSQNLIQKLSSMTANRVIGHEDIKEGILMAAANAAPDQPERRRRIHVLIFGPPGLAKTLLLLEGTKLIGKSSFDNAQTSTGLSLLAMVEKEEDAYVLRLGPIPRSSLSAIDELNRMPFSDQEKIFGVMQEGFFTSNKFANRARIRSPTTIIASANPPIGSEPDAYGRIDLNELNIIPPVLDRFDLRFYVKSKIGENEIRELAYQMAYQQDRVIADYSPFLRKYIVYSKRFNPKVSDDAKSILTEFFISMQKVNSHVTPRRLEALFNLTRARARLQLKEVADVNDAKEIITFYMRIVKDYEDATEVPEDPMDASYKECVELLTQSKIGIEFEELLKMVCKTNQQAGRYLHLGGKALRMDANKKARNLCDRLLLNPKIRRTNKNPTVLQWFDHHDLHDQEKNRGYGYKDDSIDQKDSKTMCNNKTEQKTGLEIKKNIHERSKIESEESEGSGVTTPNESKGGEQD